MEIVGRIAVTDEADLQNVKALQANLHLYQMNKEAKPAGIPTATGDNDMIFGTSSKHTSMKAIMPNVTNP
ncbi:Uncharacterised protein [Weissella viridescens]|uniref:Uncharacterized protein n=1 Tax=Weissella viridescens TaxID=1629 RepID=A0A380NY82_WEIVI|nr:Uncharacterised protein [Weissella viridescens]